MKAPVLLQAGGLVVLLFWALAAGFFYAFSVCVIPGLDRLEAPEVAAQAMQAINAAVRNPVFFVSFFAPVPLTVLLALACWWQAHHRAALLIALAAGVYVALILWPTVAINVPANEALALQNPGAVDWPAWSAAWDRSNQLRTAASALGLLLVGAGLLAMRREAPASRPT